MQWLESIILGLVQGLTEFLPVSSSGHLVIFQELMGFKPDGGIVFEVAVHVATLVAIVLFYRKRVGELTVGTFTLQTDALRYVGKLVVGTLPAIAVALLAREFIEAQFSAPAVAGSMLLITGFIVWSTRYTITKGTATEPTWANALLIGCAQAFAILPGISRSGTTVAAAMALGLTPLAAAEFSFLLGVIAIAGAAILLMPDMLQADSALLGSIVIGGIAALISGLAALVTFVWFLKKQKFYAFAWYAWAAGAAFLVWLQFSR
ncbi:MAG: undecaprenyl-diphosphate phosphatase [Pseudomonadota bacterium]